MADFNPENFETEYRDQPIRRTGISCNVSGKIPKRILQMESLYDPGLSSAEDKRRNFFVQGKYMEDYAISYDQTCRFQRWFPTYHDMREEQLLAYFGWRTKIRQEVYEQTEEAYAYVYIYELLNQIGTGTAECGFEKLESFYEQFACRYNCVEMQMNMQTWMKQYCICYGLLRDKAKRYYASEIENDCALGILNEDSQDPERVFKALKIVSSFSFESSPMMKKYPQESKELLCRIWNKLNSIAWMKNGGTLFENCFGRKDRFTTRFFSNAVYFDRLQENRKYAVDPYRIYTFENGKWYCECYRPAETKSKLLGSIVREADRQMRDAFNTGHSLRQKEADGRSIRIIHETIEEYLYEKQQASRPKIVLHTEQLSGIRADAEETREKLLTEEEREDPDEFIVKEEVKETEAYPFDLSAEEVTFLQMLMEEKDWKLFLREKHQMPSVVSESINEKLFDEFGDTVILFENDEPVLNEDYADDIKQLWEE